MDTAKKGEQQKEVENRILGTVGLYRATVEGRESKDVQIHNTETYS